MDFDIFYEIFTKIYLPGCRFIKGKLSPEQRETKEKATVFFNSSFYEKMILRPQFILWLLKYYELDEFFGLQTFDDLEKTYEEDLKDVNIQKKPKDIPEHEFQVMPSNIQEAVNYTIKSMLNFMPQIPAEKNPFHGKKPGREINIDIKGEMEGKTIDERIILDTNSFQQQKTKDPTPASAPLNPIHNIQLLCCAFPVAFVRTIIGKTEYALLKIENLEKRAYCLFFLILSAIFQDLANARIPPRVKAIRALPTMEIKYTKQLSIEQESGTNTFDSTKLTARLHIHR